MEPGDKKDKSKAQSYYEDSIQIVDSRVCPTCGLKVSASTTVCPNDSTQLVQTPKPGTMLGDKYELIEEIGTGGMGVIFKASQPFGGDRLFAIKMLHTHRLAEQGLLRFQQEARAGFNLKHPNIIAIHDFGVTDQGQPYLVMDYIKGITLSDFIESGGPLSVEKSVAIAKQICAAMKHAHETGILHRDLKSSNVMLVNAASDEPKALVVDFGMAKIVDPDAGSSSSKQLTKTGEVFGSPMYMSPEQCMGKKLDQRSDVYSFGCVLFEMLTGNPPILGDSIVETVFKQVNEAAPTLRETSKGKKFPPGLEALVARCLAKNVDDRFQSMSDIEAALKIWNKQKFFTTKTKPADGATSSASVTGQGLSRPLIALIAVCLTAVLVAAFVAIHGALNPPEAPKAVTPTYEISKEPLLEVGKTFAKVQAASDPDAEEFIMSGNAFFDDSQLQSVENLHKLRDLYLNSTSVTNAGMKYLVKLPLKKLVLDECDISEDGIKQIAKIRSLENLSLTGTSINDDCLNYLQDLPNLKRLDVSATFMTDDGFKKLAQIKSLEQLEIKGTIAKRAYFSTTGLSALAQLPRLRELNLEGSNLKDEYLSGLTKIRSLRALDISHTAITNAGLKKLTTMPLEFVNLAGDNIDDEGVAIICRMPSLDALNLMETRVSDKSMNVIGKKPGFKMLNIIGTGVSDEGMVPVGTLHNLDRLEIGSAKNYKSPIRDKGIKALNGLHKLTQLTVHGLPLSDNVLMPLIKNNPDLTIVDLSGTQISDALIPVVAKLALTSFMAQRTNLTYKGVVPLTEVKTLKFVSLINTPAGTEGDIDKVFHKVLPHCKVYLSRSLR